MLDDCEICGGDGTSCKEVKSRSKLVLSECPTVQQVDDMRSELAAQYGVAPGLGCIAASGCRSSTHAYHIQEHNQYLSF